MPAGIICVVRSRSKLGPRPAKRNRLKAYALVADTANPITATQTEMTRLSHTHSTNCVGELGSELKSWAKLLSVASGGMMSSEVLSSEETGRSATVSVRLSG